MSMLLCDFHIHTTWSDGSVPLPEVVDIYGQAGFDVISITDHIYNSDSPIGTWAERLHQTVRDDRFGDYLGALEREAERARTKYDMLVIPGVEVTKNYLSEKESAHVLLIDVKGFISPDLGWEDIFREAADQGSLIVACHPHYTDHEMHDTLYFWNNREKYASRFDAWEVANRTDLFSCVSLQNYPVIANSDFHKPSHIHSWKTLLSCRKDVESVKACIRDNRGVAITLFRNATAGR